jgi:hypothetical protein
MAHLLRSTSLLTLLATTACQAGMGPSVQPGVTAPHHVSAGDHVSAELDATADKNAELEARYRLAIEAFDKGAYDDAAAQFAQMLVHVPQDVGGDALRHLLIQHVGWSLLGSYDMSGDSSKLDSGEAILDRYLVKHEQLRPTATDERVEIYELLGEYSLRRDDKPPTNANAHLQALVRETHANLQRPAPSKHGPNEDRMVREIEVDTIRWGSLDDPRVQAYLRDLRYTGISMFELDKPYHHTRVLVRGWVGQPQQAGDPASQRSYDILRLARPTLERCYEEALGRGADTHEQVELELRWDMGSLAEIEITDQTTHDNQISTCVIAALREVAAADTTEADVIDDTRAALHLTFFVQPPRWPDRIPADVNQQALPEDASIVRCVRGPMRC